MVSTILSIVQIVVAIALVASILLQQKGSGIGNAFGGNSTVYASRRGVDRILFNITIVLSVLFFAIAIASIMV